MEEIMILKYQEEYLLIGKTGNQILRKTYNQGGATVLEKIVEHSRCKIIPHTEINVLETDSMRSASRDG
jgi:hypothetical protein